MLRLLSDEDVPGDIVHGLRQRHPNLDLVRVQEVGLMSAPDPDILEWASREDRQLFTRAASSSLRHHWALLPEAKLGGQFQ